MDLESYFDQRTPIFLKLGFQEEALVLLKRYVNLLWQSNSELNLFSRKMSVQDFIDNHIIDSMLPLSRFPAVRVVADFGSGGGLPAILFAIQFPAVHFRLYEKSKLKQKFLKQCSGFVTNLEVCAEIPSKLPEVDLITARAFKPLDVILDLSRDHYRRGGRYFLLKGRMEKIREEIVLAEKKFKGLQVHIDPLVSPVLEVERHLLTI